MGNSREFLSPMPNALVLGAFRALLPAILPAIGIASIDYDSAELARLRGLSGERVLLTPNHPTNTEPAILFHLGAMVREPFLFLACRESFDALFGLWGQITRRLGAYSVVRGTADRASFKATREYLAQPASKLVIFPEGEVYSQNDSLLPFHDGAFQLAFWALEDARKSGESEARLYVQPVAIKYLYTRDMTGPILASLERLERFTGSSVAPSETPYRRLRGIAFAMLHSLEIEYRLPRPKDDAIDSDFTPRLEAVKESILTRVAAAAGIPDPTAETLPERMRILIHAIETVTHEAPQGDTPYDTELRRHQRRRAAPLLHDLRRLANWIAVYDGYVAQDPTPERMCDTLVRLERECFGRAILRGTRRCRVRLPEPFELSERADSYRANRRAAVRSLVHDTESRILARLHER